ncbi:unnamed protein product [Caenorhabditis nigoni]
MAKRELRRSLKSEIDNLFASPETAENEFQQATKRQKRDDSESSSTPKSSGSSQPFDPHRPRVTLHLNRLGNSFRIDCETLAHFIHYTLFGNSLMKPRWTAISNHRNIPQTLAIRINVQEDFFMTTNLKFLNEFFERRWIELDSDISDRSLFWNSMMNVRLTLQEQVRRKSEKMQKTFEVLGKHDKSNFILTTAQLADRGFPFPGEEGIVPTKRRYKKLSPSSPLFSVDCEMCETTTANRALTRISIVDEEQNTILDTLVKPDGDITDYVTRYSGITEKMMEGVTTTLTDVQKAVQNLLPPDAILVGHSLEFDLRAMRMTHPFCIDVGHTLNYTNSTSGGRNSLKNLSEFFLGVQIQTKFGHCSYEDAWAAMRLAQLKIEKGLMFGNTSFGWKYSRNANGVVVEEALQTEVVSTVPCSGCTQPTVVGCTVLNCRCRFVNGPSKCVHCVKLGESIEGDFDWQDTLDLDLDKTTSPIESYLKKDKMTSLMCAFDTSVLDKLPTFSKKIRSKQSSSFSSYDSFIDSVASEMLNDSGIFLEIDKERVEPLEGSSDETGEVIDNSEGLNAMLEKLVGATTRNSLIIIIVSSPSKNILFNRIK